MTQKRRILMLTTQLGYGGAETSFIRLANFLTQSMEVTVALFTSDYGAGAYSAGHEKLDAQVVLLDRAERGGRISRWLHRIRRMRELKAQHDVTISFLSGPNVVNALSGWPSRSVVSVRGSREFDPVAPVWQRRLFQYVLDPLVFSLAGHIVPVSPGLQHEIRRVAGSKAVAKVTVIPPFIDCAVIAQRLAAPVAEKFALLRDQPLIVAVGRLSVEKGFQHLIRVFGKVAQQHPGAKLLLIGDGPMQDALRAQCEALGLAMDDVTPGVSAVVFAGYQQNALPLMALSRVFALTSATEGLPNVVLEAMAAEVSVVAANTPWGARAILRADDNRAEAYPTVQAEVTEYGVLMPRIDLPEYEAVWVEVLLQHLAEKRHYAKAMERLWNFELAQVGARWQALIARVVP